MVAYIKQQESLSDAKVSDAARDSNARTKTSSEEIYRKSTA